MNTAASVAVLRMVDAQTGMTHLIRLEVVPLHRHSGRYPALCGGEIIAASLVSDSRAGLCPECRDRSNRPSTPHKRKRRLIPLQRRRR